VNIRLQKFIRDRLGISRRDAEKLILQNRVVVNGKSAELGMSVDVQKDSVEVNGEMLKRASESSEEKTYVLLNKPAGYVTSRYDPHNPKTVYDLLPAHYRNLFPVGRLDKDTEGLLILTNDGELTYKLTHPKFEVEKEYYVVIDSSIKDSDVVQIERGVKNEVITTSPAKIKVLRKTQNESRLNITIHEGKNREVKRIFGSLGYKVVYLKRTRVSNLDLQNLKTGEFKELKKATLYSNL
jgi:23S rRNA pseudouridine2605 synthase